MNIPTGDYQVDFFNHLGEVMPNATTLAVSLIQAHEKAQCLLPLLGVNHYRIVRVVFNSQDKDSW